MEFAEREKELAVRFTGHQPTSDKVVEKHLAIRSRCLELALWIDENVPKGRQQALAMTHLEEVVMWSNKGIAENQ